MWSINNIDERIYYQDEIQVKYKKTLFFEFFWNFIVIITVLPRKHLQGKLDEFENFLGIIIRYNINAIK